MIGSIRGVVLQHGNIVRRCARHSTLRRYLMSVGEHIIHYDVWYFQPNGALVRETARTYLARNLSDTRAAMIA